ncbi:MAG: hypothetical protein US74_C0012G0034 [Parcubacteria group bacterium GW2011_GWA2_38_13]|nr:MAG: hypothetical protein US74_C0012G0034 [Parcubacteria group bacterium GW2011_GWA2_38_13]
MGSVMLTLLSSLTSAAFKQGISPSPIKCPRIKTASEMLTFRFRSASPRIKNGQSKSLPPKIEHIKTIVIITSLRKTREMEEKNYTQHSTINKFCQLHTALISHPYISAVWSIPHWLNGSRGKSPP